jgi:hypothetical protein
MVLCSGIACVNPTPAYHTTKTQKRSSHTLMKVTPSPPPEDLPMPKPWYKRFFTRKNKRTMDVREEIVKTREQLKEEKIKEIKKSKEELEKSIKKITDINGNIMKLIMKMKKNKNLKGKDEKINKEKIKIRNNFLLSQQLKNGIYKYNNLLKTLDNTTRTKKLSPTDSELSAELRNFSPPQSLITQPPTSFTTRKLPGLTTTRKLPGLTTTRKLPSLPRTLPSLAARPHMSSNGSSFRSLSSPRSLSSLKSSPSSESSRGGKRSRAKRSRAKRSSKCRM